jgi:hypothetical protein
VHPDHTWDHVVPWNHMPANTKGLLYLRLGNLQEERFIPYSSIGWEVQIKGPASGEGCLAAS